MADLMKWFTDQLLGPVAQSNKKETKSVGYFDPSAPDIERLYDIYADMEIILEADQVADVMQVLLHMLRSEFSAGIPTGARIHGKTCAYAMYFILTGNVVDWKPSSVWELEPINNLLLVAPAWIVEKIEPLMIQWRYAVHKDPDFKQMYA